MQEIPTHDTSPSRGHRQYLEAARQGDHRAAVALVEHYRRMVTTTAQLALRNRDDAQDVAQEALVYALMHLNQCRDDHKFGAWLRQITFSLCADYRRRRGTRSLGEPLPLLDAAAEETHLAERLTLQEALKGLQEPHKTTVLLHYIGGWSVEETATLLHVPANTVRSRLMAAKARLRPDLESLLSPRKTQMTTQTKSNLTQTHTNLLYAAFPEARILSVEESPEPWMPFRFRLRIETQQAEELELDLRDDLTPDQAALLPFLERAAIPCPRLLAGPVRTEGGFVSLCHAARGQNLLLWALGGTPHRIRLATERTFEAIERLHALTPVLEADPAAPSLTLRSLIMEAESVVSVGGPWLSDPWFLAALSRIREAVSDIHDPLVFTDALHYFPNYVRIAPESEMDRPFGWPGDTRLTSNPVVELVSPFGHLGDPLLGLAMVWIYDCYPFVHTGFVEQLLWRWGKTPRDFGPRLALRALQTVQRETSPSDTGEYVQALRGWVEQGLRWM